MPPLLTSKLYTQGRSAINLAISLLKVCLG
ncbi:hypothetical protein PENANT_c056G10385 [Penicillium antarcticum]|uniref:Uncharacterized protein n=1 Tax=Penicillium antarcticum TaxID=416450 RepID=A0A1V6PQI3_9EURO|nr:hypothetical protein PENANT_c056G10385 [Penicillium antarcticum]